MRRFSTLFIVCYNTTTFLRVTKLESIILLCKELHQSSSSDYSFFQMLVKDKLEEDSKNPLMVDCHLLVNCENCDFREQACKLELRNCIQFSISAHETQSVYPLMNIVWFCFIDIKVLSMPTSYEH